MHNIKKLLFIIFIFIWQVEAKAERCIMAGDFGLGGTFYIPANPDEGESTGNSQLLKKFPLDKQIAPWISTGLTTLGKSNDPSAKNPSQNSLKIYVDGQWAPWGGELEHLDQCEIRDCNDSATREKACLTGGKIVEYLDPEKVPCSLGTYNSGTSDTPPDARTLGWGLYGLIALSDDLGNAANPNDTAFFESLPPPFFRTFRMSPLQQDGTSYFFQIDTTQTCKQVNGVTTCQNDRDTSNTNDIVSKGKLYFKIVDSYYPDNVGSYYLNITRGVFVEKGFIETIIDTIIGQLSSVQENLYKAITTDYGFLTIVKLLLILYIVFTGLAFMLGMLKIHQGELVIRMIKIAIVTVLISENSWNFFNNYLFSIFTEGAKSIADVIVNSTVFYEDSESSARFILPSDSTALSVFDAILKMCISEAINVKIISLLWSSYIVYIPLFYICIYFLILAIIRCVVLYVVALMLIAIMLVISPIFISFLLFKFTKDFFDIWLKQLMASAMQLIVVSATLALMISLINDQLNQLLFYQVCYRIVWSLKIVDWTLWDFWWWTPTDFQQVINCITPRNFFAFLVICILFNAFMDEIPGMIDILSGAFLQPISHFYGGVQSAFRENYFYKTVTGGVDAARGLTVGRLFARDKDTGKYKGLGKIADYGRRAHVAALKTSKKLDEKDHSE